MQGLEVVLGFLRLYERLRLWETRVSWGYRVQMLLKVIL